MFVFHLFNFSSRQSDTLGYKWVRMWQIPKATLVVVLIRQICIVSIWNKSDKGMFLHMISRFCLPRDTRTHPEAREPSQLASVSQTRSDAFDFVITVIVRVLCRPTSGSDDRWMGIKRYSSISSDGNKWFTWTSYQQTTSCWERRRLCITLVSWTAPSASKCLCSVKNACRNGGKERGTPSALKGSRVEGCIKMMVTVWERLRTQYWC